MSASSANKLFREMRARHFHQHFDRRQLFNILDKIKTENRNLEHVFIPRWLKTLNGNSKTLQFFFKST